MTLRDLTRSITPTFVLQLFRAFKKKRTRKKIEQDLKRGKVLNQKNIEEHLKGMGLNPGDDVLVHCAFSKIGAVQGGPQTIISAFMNVLGTTGNLLMPSSSNESFQLDYIQSLTCFDVDNEPSKMGAVSEAFRKTEGVHRSSHPTEPVCVYGKNSAWYTEGHELDGTAYGKNSPFYKLTEKQGKILYIGVTLDNAGTSLHLLEDAISNFKDPVYMDDVFSVNVKKGGEIKLVHTKVHNPEQSKLRKCDGLLPMFVENKVAFKTKLGDAETWVFDAKKMFNCMIEQYEKNGVTMYNPKGQIIELKQ